jgi:beta-lactamase superfamily II metal-dependent hydrolase
MTDRWSSLGCVVALFLAGVLAACSGGATVARAPAPLPPAAARSAEPMRVHTIDVGQGNAALVEFPCAAILVDAGGEGEDPATIDALLRYLDRFFAARPDLNRTLAAVYVTHTHIDHNVSLRAVVERYTVSNYVHNGVYTGSGSRNAVWMRDHANDNGRRIAQRAVTHDDVAGSPGRRGVTDGTIDPVSCPGADPRLSILHGPYRTNPGWPEEAFEDGNNKGIVLRIDYGAASFLFLGDLETEALDEMVRFYAGTPMLEVDVFLASHHGSHNGTTPGQMAALSPRIGVISMGRPTDRADEFTAWNFGHPRKVAVDLMVAAVKDSRAVPKDVQVATRPREFFTMRMTKALYATGWDGTVVIEADQSGRIAVNDNALVGMAAAQ